MAELYQELAVAIGRAGESAEEAARAPDPAAAEPPRRQRPKSAGAEGAPRVPLAKGCSQGAVLPKAPPCCEGATWRNLRAAEEAVEEDVGVSARFVLSHAGTRS